MDREEKYTTQVVEWMLKETKIDTSHEDPSQWNIYAPHIGRWISPMGIISPNNRHWTAFQDHVMDIYALDWDYVGPVWDNYLKEVTKIFRELAGKAMGDDTPPWDMQYDYMEEGLNNQKSFYINELVGKTIRRLNENLDSKIHKAVKDALLHNSALMGQRNIKKYFMKHYGLDKWEADQAMVQYLSKQQSLNEGRSKEEMDYYIQIADRMAKYQKFYDGIIDRLVDGTKIRIGQYGGSASQEPMEMPFIKPPFLYYNSQSPTRNLLHSEIPVSEIENYYSDFLNYIRSIYEMPENEIKKLFKPFLVNLMDKVENEIGDPAT